MTLHLSPEVQKKVREAFDADFYLAANKDVREAGIDPFLHFLTYGAEEGRDPRPDFSMKRYLALHLDVGEAGMDPFVHWVTDGRAEGRATDHGLGYQYEVLWAEKPLEERMRSMRLALPDRAPDPPERLNDALGAVGQRHGFHVTVSHDDFGSGVGGVQLCIRLEAEAQRRKDLTHIHLFPSATAVVVDIERERPTLGVVVDGVFAGHHAHDTVAAILAPVMAGQANVFAIHSLIGHAAEPLSGLLARLGMTSGFFWLHDYASLCAGYALMRDDVAFCGAPSPDSTACEVCSYGRRRRVQLPTHVELFQRFALTAVAPSQVALSLWRSRFPVRAAAEVVHPHARLEPRADQPAPKVSARKRPLRIGFLGMPALHKGWPIFADLVARFGRDSRYEFHHLSAVREPRVVARFTKVVPTPAAPQPMIPAIEKLDLDVALIWSLWPETFCIAAHEAAAAGAAVLTGPASGNVAAFVAGDASRGTVLGSEAALFDLFASGAVGGLSRVNRKPILSDLIFSGMVADLTAEAAA
ncbi:glycosyltransferase family protein [Brevundimonas bacteroides]|uniref:hypothetical protein n=1 Tax=Brevundimonas bacteroides TaxID=74311 RepID=UPI00068F0662|nr:hypothetical protein [Brevundimonas bacteroides]